MLTKIQLLMIIATKNGNLTTEIKLLKREVVKPGSTVQTNGLTAGLGKFLLTEWRFSKINESFH